MRTLSLLWNSEQLLEKLRRSSTELAVFWTDWTVVAYVIVPKSDFQLINSFLHVSLFRTMPTNTLYQLFIIFKAEKGISKDTRLPPISVLFLNVLFSVWFSKILWSLSFFNFFLIFISCSLFYQIILWHKRAGSSVLCFS